MIAGNIGSTQHMEYTVVGSTVNTASRIQELTKVHKTDLLISQTVQKKVADKFLVSAIENVQIRGMEELMTVFEVDGFINSDGKEWLVPSEMPKAVGDGS